MELDKNERALLKHLVKRELKDFEDDEKDVEITHPHISQLVIEEKYKDYLEKLIKKLD